MLISVIVPVYNAEHDIYKCIKSVLSQTYKNFELIIVDDKSTDKTLDIIKNISDDRIILIEKEKNGGQGESRNIGLKIAKGEYVTFLDADDLLKNYALEVLVERKGESSADMVIGDWYYNKDGLKTPSNLWWLFNKKIIDKNNKGCLLVIPYFSIAKLYNRKFIVDNNIWFGEGYIYEDNPFYVGVMLKANIILLCEKIVYEITVSSNSSTKTNLNGDYHAECFLKATEEIYNRYLAIMNQYSVSYLTYSINRAFLYSDLRMPKNIKYIFLKKIVEMHEKKSRKLLEVYGRKLKEIRYILFSKKIPLILRIYAYEKFLNREKSFILKKTYPKVKELAINLDDKRKKILSKYKSKPIDLYKNKLINCDIDNKTIIFYGFDGKDLGNSKYLLNAVVESKYFKKIYTVDFYRDGCTYVKKDSLKYFKAVSEAKFHILESWLPLSIVKKPNSIWIQLWHGTPLKKLLLDSPETEIIAKAPRHKLHKMKDIFRWDFIISQGSYSVDKFQTSLGLNKDQILNFGYPRTDILFESNQHNLISNNVRSRLGIPADKKILLYTPTWRDINYGKKIKDNSYLLNSDFFENLLDDYVILFRGHSYHKDMIDLSENIINVSNYDDVQELLIASDYLITDYSSILIDFILLNKPFAIFAEDFQIYDRTRGLYNDFKNDFRDYIFSNKDDLLKFIKESPDFFNFDQLAKFKDYEDANSCLKLIDFLKEIKE
jgi:CDP-glycerol glycerophosphotransferase